jgi:hypothetical protein
LTRDDRHVLANSEALVEFETAIGRFAGQSMEKARRAESEIRRVREDLEERQRGARRDVRALGERIADADKDDDCTVLERERERATEELSFVRKQIRDVDAAADRFKTARVRFEELNGDTTHAARSFLRKIISDLQAYLALQKSGAGGITSSRGSDGSVSTPAASSLPEFNPTSLVLPPGYRWMQLSEIDTDRELADVQDERSFSKGVSYLEMTNGFEVLRREILPAVGDSRTPATSDTFAAWDSAAGVSYSEGKQRIYDAFFGDDPIYVQPGGSASRHTVSSGRHRIKVAMDLRWTAVPVKSRETPQQ